MHFVEFGAGKGHLTLRLYETLKMPTSCILVDRMKLKFKCENKVLDREAAMKDIKRITADIRHLNISGVELIKPKGHVFGMSKHLCGAATDLTLRCLVNTLQSDQVFSGVAIAVCCHHRCTWDDYVAKEYFTDTLVIYLFICYYSSTTRC